MSKIVRNYGKKFVPDLVLLLTDSTRDWAANILLYSITETNATMLKYYPTSKMNEWRRERKDKDVERWRNYLKINTQ